MKQLIVLFLFISNSSIIFSQATWPAAKAKTWYAKQGWLVGCNFIPSTAVNQLEMWQAESFDTATINKELGYAASIGMNAVRVFLHDLLWQQDKEGFKQRIRTFLTIAERQHLRILFVFFDDCWYPDAKLGKQPAPKPGSHNSGWKRSPAKAIHDDSTQWHYLEAYVKDIIGSFKNDKRIVCWDLYNEPGNSGYKDSSLPLLKKVFAWARTAGPSQPLTVGVWNASLQTLNDFQSANSDVISFHSYGDSSSLRKEIEWLQQHGKPILCTEWLARGRNCKVETNLPVFKKYNVAAMNWGLVSGKTNTIYPWSSVDSAFAAEPVPWHHDLFRPGGIAYDEKETALFQQLTGKKKGNANTTIQQTSCNPINLSYRFCLDSPSRREAADPTLVLYKGVYYLFASKSGGYFQSDDLMNWKLISTTDLPIEDYAPTAVVINDTLYFMASHAAPVVIYKTTTPETGKWEVAKKDFPIGMIDPALFLDSDGRLFCYYGCSNINPIYGVGLDTKTFNPIGEPIALFNSHKEIYGWERKGDYNDQPLRPWIEGAWMTKHNGKYYLQYAAPGTEYKSYCDAVYVSDKPLGPFTVAKHNPASFKPEGFAAGAGHGSTFLDKYGNYWHIATNTISVKHMFERRLSLFPAFFDEDGELYVNTCFGDWPMKMPTKKINSADELFAKWMLLSYNKPVTVSSAFFAHPKTFASDEDIRTFWSAKTGSKSEWLVIDLEKLCTINAVQINFAEHETTVFGRAKDVHHQYLLEYSADNKTWKTLADKTNNTKDAPHDYMHLKKPVQARYIRIKNYKVPSGTFAISDLRVFGNDEGELPAAVETITAERQEDRCVVKLSWPKVAGAVGYNIRYGIAKDKLYHTYQVLGKESVTINSLNSLQGYYFTVEVFDESGVSGSAAPVYVH